MVELFRDRLSFRFPEVHERADLQVVFQRTLRIPDDDGDYPLPPGLGPFPVRHVDDYARRVPAEWIEHGGVIFPMYQSEAMWLLFHSTYPFAVKVLGGKINAVTGEAMRDGLHRGPQDYLVVPDQPWLDGYCIEKGVIRQFVAMPLGAGYSPEEQLTGKAEHGGLQLIVYPMKGEVFDRLRQWYPVSERLIGSIALRSFGKSPAMALGAGGRMRQEIFHDKHDLADWDQRHSSRCFVHLANSLLWREITGEAPPTKPPSAKEYVRAGLPWFEYYDDSATATEGSEILKRVKSVFEFGRQKEAPPLPDNDSVDVEAHVVSLRRGLAPGQVREGTL